jgi:hypothetical protein
MAKAGTTIALEEGEYALVIGQEGERMSVRTEGAELLGDEAGELPIPAALVAALAARLLHDPEFQDEVLEWFEQHLEDAGERDEDAAGEG